MPATWLAWSMISFVVSIMSFVWRTGTVEDGKRPTMTRAGVLGPRILVSVFLALGLIYFFLIASTLGRYGELMDKKWKTRIDDWLRKGSLDRTCAPTTQYTSDIPPSEDLRKAPSPTDVGTQTNFSNSSGGSPQSSSPVPDIQVDDRFSGFERAKSPAQLYRDSHSYIGQTEPGPRALTPMFPPNAPSIEFVKLLDLSLDVDGAALIESHREARRRMLIEQWKDFHAVGHSFLGSAERHRLT